MMSQHQEQGTRKRRLWTFEILSFTENHQNPFDSCCRGGSDFRRPQNVLHGE